MKYLVINFLICLFLTHSNTIEIPGSSKENFSNNPEEIIRIKYKIIGLGSNRGEIEEMKMVLDDSVLEYYDTRGVRIIKKLKSNNLVDSVNFELSKIKGTSTFNSNHLVMSGSIRILEFQGGDWCSKIILKNITDSIAVKIIDLLNPYLPEKGKIVFPHWYKQPESVPLRYKCEVESSESIYEFLSKEGELLRYNYLLEENKKN